MSRQPSRHSPYDDEESPWSAAEVAVLTSATDRAPSVHNTRPWSLDVHGRTAVLRERTDLQLPEHDPEGRDRHMSCGAALANLVLAVRSLGWSVDPQIESVAGAGTVATVVGAHRMPPTTTQTRRYEAIEQRLTHRSAFARQPLSDAEQDAVRTAATSPAVSTRWVSGEAEALAVARLLGFAARVYRDNPEYQRELDSWTQPPGAAGLGLSDEALSTSGLGAVGLVTSRTRLPDEFLLASCIEQESVLVLATRADEPGDHVQVGEAAEAAWLDATSMGLGASIMTQVLHLEEVRTRLADRLGLATVPQMLMRFGYPAARTSPQRYGGSDVRAETS